MKKKITILIILIAFIAVFLYSQNNWIGTTRLQLAFDRLPKEFDGFKIIQLSDLHGKSFGAGQQRLINIINKSKPDIIVITGDLTDNWHYDEQPALEMIKNAVKTSPVYFVTGNHEMWSGKFSNFEVRLKEAGAIVLRNECKEVKYRGENIFIAGFDDPGSLVSSSDEKSYFEIKLKDIASSIPEESFKVLISHRPEKLREYSKYGFDIIFSGHAHGGQFRLPFVGGLVAPDQGFFPEFSAGVYRDQSSVMVVSRGLGNSIIPQRIFNRPEVIGITLESK